MQNETGYTCTNCGVQASGSFCATCGQKRFFREQFRLKRSLREIFSEFSDLESSLVKTIGTLVSRPGKLTADYLTGKQKSYVTPVKLYLIIITANFLVYAALEDYSLVNIELLKRLANDITWFQQSITNALNESGLADDDFFHRVNSQVNDTLPFLLYFLIFAQAVVLKVQFRKHGRYYIEHLVFALHFMSFGFLRDIALLPVHFFSREAGFSLSILTTVCYLFLSFRKAYRLGDRKLFFHTVTHYVIFFALFTITIISSVVMAMHVVSTS
jgi:hypothetical protein